ncbi:HK97 gp10 family phage protein [Joostella sp.]|uniref:HK97 gp10 family phage protein n=1 Tax=Joostella sp. TaxID=2231138 RepID=UPI003A8E3019
MARVNGLKPLFSINGVQNYLDDFVRQQDDKMLNTLQYAGEQFVNKARLTGNYTDRTGNLRSSIGYIILKDGQIIDQNFSGNNEGQEKGKETADEVSQQYPNGFVLIGVAGMEYAAAVEAKNYDVITGSAPTAELFKSILDGINFGR